MSYEGPSESDYTNIQALNREFLRLARSRPLDLGLSEKHGRRLQALGGGQTERLAETPFLLFTVAEDNLQVWRELLQNNPVGDLFRKDRAVAAETGNLLATTVGFLWQLTQRNRYSVRLISAAQPEWCDLVADVTYFELVSSCRPRGDLLTVRRVENADIWSKLLSDGVRAENEVRTAAHIATLQTLLTCTPANGNDAWQIAACGTRQPSLRVADCKDRRNKG